MRILVVGSGAREHAITWKLSQSPLVEDLIVAPGNAGTAEIASNVNVSPEDLAGLHRLARDEAIDLTVVGPEAPLAAGIADRFQDAGLPIFGPTCEAARIESSKLFAKRLMLDSGIPTSAARAFSSFGEASEYVEGLAMPVVVKADGLAAGKGVVVADSRDEAMDALQACLEARVFGAAGEVVLIEECLVGREVSVFAFVDGAHVSAMVAACDYKRAEDGDAGPNTGGMGSFTPPSFWDEDLEHRVRTEIMEPAAAALAERGSPYTGVLYAGIMVTEEGPRVFEFNCRLGDPETQVVLPRLKTDLAEVMMCTARGSLSDLCVDWGTEAAVGVVVASGGYPGSYDTGFQIDGLESMEDAVVFHAGTRPDARGEVLTDGGRVLTVVSTADSVEEARRRVYGNVSRIGFSESFYRTDIAAIP